MTDSGLNYGIRTTPDVSFNADPNSGVAVYDSVSDDGQSGWFQVGGTSAAAPAWAGLVAITDQGLALAGKGTLSTNQLQTDLYSLPSNAFHDITTGFNGYFASQGYDLVTGLGTPVANVLVPDVLSASGVSANTIVSPTPNSTPAHGNWNQHLVVVTSPSSGSSNGVNGSSSSSSSTVSTGTAAASTATSVTAGQSLTALPVQGLSTQVAASQSSQAQQNSLVTASAASTRGSHKRAGARSFGTIGKPVDNGNRHPSGSARGHR